MFDNLGSGRDSKPDVTHKGIKRCVFLTNLSIQENIYTRKLFCYSASPYWYECLRRLSPERRLCYILTAILFTNSICSLKIIA